MSLRRHFKSYVGIKSCQSKLEKWLHDFNFTDLETADRKIDWSKKKIIDIIKYTITDVMSSIIMDSSLMRKKQNLFLLLKPIGARYLEW